MIVFAAIAPHPPLLLPSVGTEEDRQEVLKTIGALDGLAMKFKKAEPDTVIISAPHPDWGFNVPLHFIAKNFKGEIETVLTDFESPAVHFERGKIFFEKLDKNKRYALVASGDPSHCLKKEGPYGFHPDGPKFDEALKKYLISKNIDSFLVLEREFPEAGECGLRSFAFLLGVLTASGTDWQPKILSYEGPFGVGYLVANLL